MIPKRGISKKRMAVKHLGHSFDDSLENAAKGELCSATSAAHADSREKPDYQTFRPPKDDVGSALYLGLISSNDLCLLQDETDGKNRALGVAKLQEAIELLDSAAVVENNLEALLRDARLAVSDSHIKVSLAGLHLLGCVLQRAESDLTTYLPSVVHCVLGKMGTSKYVLREAGMRVLMQLMRASRPAAVTQEIASFGLNHKQSKVREESLNVITAALITFPKSEFPMNYLAADILSTMCDEKSKVRQASMECAVKALSLCSTNDFKQVMAIFSGNDRMEIFEALKRRHLRKQIPTLKKDGLVEYGVPVLDPKIPTEYVGADVDWIRYGALKNGLGPTLKIANGLNHGSGAKETRSHPFRSSASRQLPWEQKEDGKLSKSKLGDTSASTAKLNVSTNIILLDMDILYLLTLHIHVCCL